MTHQVYAHPAAVAGAAARISAADKAAMQLHARLVLNAPPVDVNVQWVNDVLIQGTGAPPDHWRPAP